MKHKLITFSTSACGELYSDRRALLFCGLMITSLLIATGCSSPDDNGFSLLWVEVKTQRVTPDFGYRPDVVAIQDTLYFAYNAGPQIGFRLLQLDDNLSARTQAVDLFSARTPIDTPTDIRVAAGASNRFWYGFETVDSNGGSDTACGGRFLNAAIYDSAGATPSLIASAFDLVIGCPPPKRSKGSPAFHNRAIVDDPTPLFHRGSYYLLTRSATGPKLHFQVYDESFKETATFTVDLEPTIGNRSVTQNALVSIEDQIYLVAGVISGAPVVATSTGRLLAIPLSDDLRSVSGKVVELRNDPNEFNTRVTSAIYFNGALLTNGMNHWGNSNHNEAVEYLHVFDVANGFSMAERFEISRGENADHHSSLAVMGDKIYFFYQTPDRKLLVKVFEQR